MEGLGINLPSLVTQFVNFGVLLAVLWIFLHRPLRRILDERRRRIEEGLHASERAQVAAEEAQRDAQAEIQKGRDEGQALVAQAQQIAQRVQTDAQVVARAEAEQIIQRARQEIQRERDQALAQLRDEFANLTIQTAERVIGQTLDRDAHQQLIADALAGSAFGAEQRN